MTLDLSKIPNVEARRKLAALEAERESVETEKSGVATELKEASRLRYNAARAAYVQAHRAIDAEFDPQIKALEQPFDERIIAIDAEIGDLAEEIESGDRLMNDDYTAALNCAVTGLPLFDDDTLIIDEESGDRILRDALPWPETAAEDDEYELAEGANEQEAAT